MESPVVLDKPPEYHGSDVNRGFPFEDEEASGAWSELAARHPDIAARLRQRPASATWARKRRPSNQDAADGDYGENFGSFDRFPFDDIPAEFREHFPSHWNRGFASREDEAPPPAAPPADAAHGSPPPPPPHQHSAATQTEGTQPEPADPDRAQNPLPQYGLRNTVDLGQKSPADPSIVDAEDRTHRSMSAPPAARPSPDMSSQRPEPPPHADAPSNVRMIPIFVEGRDEPVVHRAEPAPPSAPLIDRDQYFTEDAAPSFHPPPHFPRAFGTPSSKPFRQGSQPFSQQKVFPQSAFTRGASPQRPQPEEHFVKVPVHHEQATPAKPPAPAPAPAPAPHKEHTPPPKPPSNDPITQIVSIQKDVLDLMNEVENFTGCKKDKRYLFLDEMLTRNLIKLDNIETEGKENIRLARREAIRCIEKCIAVLESKAEKNGQPKEPDVDMKEVLEDAQAPATENGEVEMKEAQLHAEQIETPAVSEEAAPPAEAQLQPDKPAEPPQPDSNPSELKPAEPPTEVQDKQSPKKKVVKKRDKSKDKAPADSVEAAKDSIKADENVEIMQVDNKGDKSEKVMDVDGAGSQ